MLDYNIHSSKERSEEKIEGFREISILIYRDR